MHIETCVLPLIHACLKVIGFYCNVKTMVFKFKISICNFVSCIMRCFGISRPNFMIFPLCVWYLYLSKVSKVKKNVVLNRQIAEIKTNIQSGIKEMYPYEWEEHHREHRRRIRGINQLCLGAISEYWENSYSRITQCELVPTLSPPAQLVAYQHNRGWVRAHSCLISK